MPVGEAHGHPPNLANQLTLSSIIWELGSVNPKAHVHMHQVQRPVLNEGAHMCPNPWPNLGIINTSHVSTPCHTLASLGALEEEEENFQTTPHGEYATERPSQMLLEKVRDTCMCKDRRPSLNVDVQTHQTTK